jgi:arginyl-tRNA synthetase
LAKSDSSNPVQTHNYASLQPEETSILRWLYRYPETVQAATKEYAPHMICQYLFELAGRYNAFYNKHSILGNEMRLLLTKSVSIVLKNGLNLLGITTPERM